jgi:hypothetical protein
MKKHDHPFIVKIIEDFISASGNQCIVLNYYHQGDFSKFLKERMGTLLKEEEIT